MAREIPPPWCPGKATRPTTKPELIRGDGDVDQHEHGGPDCLYRAASEQQQTDGDRSRPGDTSDPRQYAAGKPACGTESSAAPRSSIVRTWLPPEDQEQHCEDQDAQPTRVKVRRYQRRQQPANYCSHGTSDQRGPTDIQTDVSVAPMTEASDQNSWHDGGERGRNSDRRRD